MTPMHRRQYQGSFPQVHTNVHERLLQLSQAWRTLMTIEVSAVVVQVPLEHGHILLIFGYLNGKGIVSTRVAQVIYSLASSTNAALL